MSDRTTTSSSARGYTLLELLMVVALLGLAASLLVPYLHGRTSLEAQGTVRRIITDLAFAQSDAMAHQDYRRVEFFADGKGYALVRVLGGFDDPFDPDNMAQYIDDPMSAAGMLEHYIVDFNEQNKFHGVTITEVDIDDGARRITYDTLGGTVMAGGAMPGIGGHIIVSSDEATYRIDIAPFTGKLTVTQID